MARGSSTRKRSSPNALVATRLLRGGDNMAVVYTVDVGGELVVRCCKPDQLERIERGSMGSRKNDVFA